MTGFQHNGEYPRVLSSREREWIEWILPSVSPAYKTIREAIHPMMVIGQGRRGKGEIILGTPDDKPDFSAPLSPVAAYGVVKTTTGTISVTVREPFNNQVSVEIVSQNSEDIPAHFEEIRRWTYSEWMPGKPCPQCMLAVREVPMRTTSSTAGSLVLALCDTDMRLWVYDATSGVNRLIPPTNYYNELMLHKNIRDPKIALDAKRLFSELATYTDAELAHAFLTYNKIRMKVHVEGSIRADTREKHGFRNILGKIFNLHS